MCWVTGEPVSADLSADRLSECVCGHVRIVRDWQVAINVASNFPLPRLYSFTHSLSYIARDTQNDAANNFVFLNSSHKTW
jgi:hypothetical protein